MDLYAAIDVDDGVAVRLVRGDFSKRTDYGDPVTLAIRFAEAGAPWLHVVDLGAARTGEPVNRDTVVAIARASDTPVQAGGGIRTERDVDELLAAGVARVVLGTAAAQDPDFAHRAARTHPGRVAAGVDYRRDGAGRAVVAVSGWERSAPTTAGELLSGLEGARLGAVVATAIDQDGTLGGPDLDGLSALLGLTSLPVIASGGVSSAADLRRLAGLRVDADGVEHRLRGVVCGRALLDGQLGVEEGVAACAASG